MSLSKEAEASPLARKRKAPFADPGEVHHGTAQKAPKSPNFKTDGSLSAQEDGDSLTNTSSSDEGDKTIAVWELKKPSALSGLLEKAFAATSLSMADCNFLLDTMSACLFSHNEADQAAAFNILRDDPRVKTILPNLIALIRVCTEQVRCIGFRVLQTLMKVLERILNNNQGLDLDEHMEAIRDSILASIMGNAVSPQDNHYWDIRNVGVRLMTQVFNQSKKMKEETQDILRFSLQFNANEMGLATLYGMALLAGEYSSKELWSWFMPAIKNMGVRCEQLLIKADAGSPNKIDKSLIGKIETLVVNIACPLLRATDHHPSDGLNEYIDEFGYFGSAIHSTVTEFRRLDERMAQFTQALAAQLMGQPDSQ